MLRLILLLSACFRLSVCSLAAQEPNPLLDMIGKEYSVYFDRFEALNDSLFYGDSLARTRYRILLAEAAAADPTGEWELNRRFVECQLRFYESREGGFIAYGDYKAEDMAGELRAVAREAQKKGLLFVQLRALFRAADTYRIFMHEYEKAFACYLEVADELEKLSHREFPWKLYMYREIANFYASFREYTDAARFYHKIIDDPDVTYKNNYRLYPALHGLAECYRQAGEYDRSDSCFLRILELSAPYELDTWVWEGIARGNIGYNYYLRGDTDKALEWMKPALAKMKRPNDDPYTSRLAADIANIYLRRGDLDEGKKYLDIALDYYRRTRLPEKSSHLLATMTRYHAVDAGKAEVSIYLDSTLRAKDKEQEAFSGLVLRRVEQRLRATDQKVHEQKLGAEKERSRTYRLTALLITVALVVILMLLLLVAFYYRRTHRAYRELVRKSQQWAGVAAESDTQPDDESLSAEPDDEAAGEQSPATSPAETAETMEAVKPRTPPDEYDWRIMEQIEKFMLEEKAYKKTDLTLSELVNLTGLNRGYVSAALNRCAGKNFNAYINEYRVKEAVRLMSEPDSQQLTIDAIANDAGFNDRIHFYRSFKKLTGLSPTDFRKNIWRQ